VFSAGDGVYRLANLIDPQLLQTEPPRQLPLSAIAAMVGRRLRAVASRVLLDPLLLGGFAGVLVLVLIGSRRGALLFLLVLALRTWMRWRGVIRDIQEDITLLREGRVMQAVVLRAKVNQTLSSEIDGAYLDCAVPIAAGRTHVGSVWLADATGAMEIARRGRIRVLCLSRVPGSWRLLEGGAFEIRSSGGLTAEQRSLLREEA
jgi:hypothetical protein